MGSNDTLSSLFFDIVNMIKYANGTTFISRFYKNAGIII